MFPRWIDGPIAWEYAPQIGGSLDGMMTEYTFPFDEVPAAFRYFERAQPFGKVVITHP